MRLSEGISFKTCAITQARDQNVNRANLYENEMVSTYGDLNRPGASPSSATAQCDRITAALGPLRLGPSMA